MSKGFILTSFSILGKYLGYCQQTCAVFSDIGVTTEFPKEKSSEPGVTQLPLKYFEKAARWFLIPTRLCEGRLGMLQVYCNSEEILM